MPGLSAECDLSCGDPLERLVDLGGGGRGRRDEVDGAVHPDRGGNHGPCVIEDPQLEQQRQGLAGEHLGGDLGGAALGLGACALHRHRHKSLAAEVEEDQAAGAGIDTEGFDEHELLGLLLRLRRAGRGQTDRDQGGGEGQGE